MICEQLVTSKSGTSKCLRIYKLCMSITTGGCPVFSYGRRNEHCCTRENSSRPGNSPTCTLRDDSTRGNWWADVLARNHVLKAFHLNRSCGRSEGFVVCEYTPRKRSLIREDCCLKSYSGDCTPDNTSVPNHNVLLVVDELVRTVVHFALWISYTFVQKCEVFLVDEGRIHLTPHVVCWLWWVLHLRFVFGEIYTCSAISPCDWWSLESAGFGFLI